MPRFRFSMWWLMVAVTVACLLLFLYVTFGGIVDLALAALLTGLLPTPLCIIAIYGRDDLRAFAIGALVPWAVTLLDVPGSLSMSMLLFWLMPLCAVCGIIAVATRRWIKAGADH